MVIRTHQCDTNLGTVYKLPSRCKGEKLGEKKAVKGSCHPETDKCMVLIESSTMIIIVKGQNEHDVFYLPLQCLSHRHT